MIYFHCRKEITSLVMLSIFCHLNKSENAVIKCSAKLWYISASRRVRTIHSSKTARAYTYLSESDFSSGEKSKEGKTYWVLFKNGNFYTICISKHWKVRSPFRLKTFSTIFQNLLDKTMASDMLFVENNVINSECNRYRIYLTRETERLSTRENIKPFCPLV